jgi:hypothetical protein
VAGRFPDERFNDGVQAALVGGVWPRPLATYFRWKVIVVNGARVERHYWLPVPNAGESGGIRHAFRGGRWDGQASDTTVCGDEVAMAQPSQMDWINFPSCGKCNDILKSEHRS